MIAAFYRYYLVAITLLILLAAVLSFHRSGVQSTTPMNSPLSVIQETDTALGFPSALEQPSNNTTLTGPLSPERSAPKGSKIYRNEKYRFELFYPQELSILEHDEGNNAITITFEKSDLEGFQIFVVPYGQRQVSRDRFHMDEPSGIMKEPVDVVIDSIRGTMFFGKNDVMGDTREVWFIRGGYLFEVTSYKDLDAWLSQIMATWKFI